MREYEKFVVPENPSVREKAYAIQIYDGDLFIGTFYNVILEFTFLSDRYERERSMVFGINIYSGDTLLYSAEYDRSDSPAGMLMVLYTKTSTKWKKIHDVISDANMHQIDLPRDIVNATEAYITCNKCKINIKDFIQFYASREYTVSYSDGCLSFFLKGCGAPIFETAEETENVILY